MDKSFIINTIQAILTINCVTAVIQTICTVASVDRKMKINAEDSIQYVLAGIKIALNLTGLFLGAAALKMAS